MKNNFLGCLRADLTVLYGSSRWSSLIHNPAAQACALVRAAQFAPGGLYPLFRFLLVLIFSMEVGKGVRIGPGLRLPHPVGIVIGMGSTIGCSVTLYQHVTIGLGEGGYPTLRDGVTVYPSAVVVGNIIVGENARIGALTFVDKNVGAGTCVHGHGA